MSEITSWYAGKNVLVTGSTGFCGKVVVERLLRDCEDVNCIYLILRPKRNGFNDRCQALLNHIVFDYIRYTNPKQLEKIKFLQGSLEQENLGLSSENLSELLNNTDIILHLAADVRFDIPLCDIYKTNTIGTHRLMELAKQIKKLQIFVYVSTAFSQSHQYVTEERHYDAVIDPFVLTKAFDRFDDKIMTALQEKIINGFPNTYSFSKHLAEHIVYQYRDEIPICVVRPSIVCSAIKYPMPAYSEGFQSFNGFTIGGARGVLRSWYGDVQSQMQIIPVDVVADAIIATSWIHGSKKLDHIKYYTTNIRNKNLKSLTDLNERGQELHKEYPLDYALWSPKTTSVSCVYYYYMRVFFYQILPSIILDLLLWTFRRRPIMIRIQRKIVHGMNQVMPYMKKMVFESNNFGNIENYLSPVDRVRFDTNIDDLMPEQMIENNLRGIRRYIVNEKDENLPRARKVNLIWSWVHLAMKCIVGFFLFKFVMNRIFYNILN